jgi:hypothetical protein
MRLATVASNFSVFFVLFEKLVEQHCVHIRHEHLEYACVYQPPVITVGSQPPITDSGAGVELDVASVLLLASLLA